MSSLKEITIEGSSTDIGANVLDGCGDALLVKCPPDSDAMTYAVANRLDYDADTAFFAEPFETISSLPAWTGSETLSTLLSKT